MKIGTLDLDPRYEYIIVYRDKRDSTINTWTLNESALQINYRQMKEVVMLSFLAFIRS